MAWWLATPADGTARTSIPRFDPRYWTVNFPRPMMAALTNPLTTNDALRVDCVFYTQGDLAGLIWESEDTLDHPLLRYQTLRDYSGCTLSFHWKSSGIVALDQTNGPTLTIEGRDTNGNPKSWYVRLWNYATGTPTNAEITINFDALVGGFHLPEDSDPVRPGYIDRMFVSLVPNGYIENSTTPLVAPVEGFCEITAMRVSGTGAAMQMGNSRVATHDIGICTGYDDQYNVSAARTMRNIQWMGYQGVINHYVGMSHYFRLAYDSGSGKYLAHTNGGALNVACTAWHNDFAQRCKALGYGLIMSLSYELFDPHCPEPWKQRDYTGAAAATGYVPPSTLLSPCNTTAMGYLHAVGQAFANIAASAGLDVKFQVGEPWWWTQPSNGRICLYDDASKAAFGGNPVVITNIHQPMSQAQKDLMDQAGAALAASTAALVQAVRDQHPAMQSLLLFYLPTVLDATAPELSRANVPIGWSKPAFDVLQLEDYDWVTDNAGLTNTGISFVTNRLGYPIADQEYFSGFVMFPEDKGDWSLIDAAAEASKIRGTKQTYFWALPQVMRDGFVHSDRGIRASSFVNSGVLWPLSPNWKSNYSVTYEFKTDIFTSRSGREQRRAQRTSPRKQLKFSVLRQKQDARTLSRLLTQHQSKTVTMADLSRFARSTAVAPAGASTIKVDAAARNWIASGRAIVLYSALTFKTADVLSVNTTTGVVTLADPLDRDWPVGTKIHPPLNGRLANSLEVKNYSDRVVSAEISFAADPGAVQPDDAGTPSATFNGREVFTYNPNFVEPIQGGFARATDAVDFGRGRIATYLPVAYSTRTKQYQMLLRTQSERRALVSLFLRQKGMRGEFYMPSFEHDFIIYTVAAAGATSAVFKGTDLADVFNTDKVHHAVIIKAADGTISYRTIISAFSDGTNSTLVTDTGWPAAIDATVTVTWLIVHRFATDALTVDCVTDEVSQVQLSVTSLEDLPVTGADAFSSSPIGGPTTAFLLDTAILADSDDNYGFYIAAASATAPWPEAQLFKSFNGGGSFSSFVHLGGQVPIGTTETALAPGKPFFFDEINSVVVNLINTTQTLTSTTKVNVLRGQNLALIGGELVQFREATFLAPGRYRLSGLLRGRRGTEDQIATHAAGDRFALLSSTTVVRPTVAASDLGTVRQYKAVTSGSDINTTATIDFTLTGRFARPYAPSHVRGARDSGGNLAITWKRRSRIDGSWDSGHDVPLGEATEAYQLDILTSDGATVKRTLSASNPAATYSASDQIADFGSIQSALRIRLFQISSRVGRGIPKETIL